METGMTFPQSKQFPDHLCAVDAVISTWNKGNPLRHVTFPNRVLSSPPMPPPLSSLYTYPKHYSDVIVCGAGHAGVEAALAAARLGCQTAILTQNLDTISQMSCNPAIGGLAKGHLVREIDALGGIMGRNTDATGIQFRMLNARKGPSVQAPRAQCDKKAYQFRMKWILESQPNLDLHQGNAAEVCVEDDRVTGVRTSLGILYPTHSVIISAGTFMRGLLHVGLQNQAGGRMGDTISTLSDSLRHLGFEVKRFKTGTPAGSTGAPSTSPRPRFRTVTPLPRASPSSPETYPRMRTNCPRRRFRPCQALFTLNSWMPDKFHVEQNPCWITYTSPQTHDIIRANLDKSPDVLWANRGRRTPLLPLHRGQSGPLCREGSAPTLPRTGGSPHPGILHQRRLHLPPFDVQLAFIRSIAGLEKAEIIRPGYAVEYDYCPPTQLRTPSKPSGSRTLLCRADQWHLRL
jgi:tRNA uridine 5-carboxymethylaminomethyl modification enzyme